MAYIALDLQDPMDLEDTEFMLFFVKALFMVTKCDYRQGAWCSVLELTKIASEIYFYSSFDFKNFKVDMHIDS